MLEKDAKPKPGCRDKYKSQLDAGSVKLQNSSFKYLVYMRRYIQSTEYTLKPHIDYTSVATMKSLAHMLIALAGIGIMYVTLLSFPIRYGPISNTPSASMPQQLR